MLSCSVDYDGFLFIAGWAARTYGNLKALRTICREQANIRRSEDVDGCRRTGCSLWTKSYKRRKGRTSVLKVLSMEKICCIFDFQWKDIVAPLYHHFDTKKVVLQTSVGASSKDRLEEFKTMDAK